MASLNTLEGSSGDDQITGSVSNDLILGKDGHDRLAGDLGNDLIISGRGSDTIDGGDGNDVIITGHQYEVEASTSSIWVTIDDYYSTYGTVSTDRIQLAAGTGNDVVITSQIIDGSNLSGGDGFDILSFNSNTVQPNAEISGFEVWNLAGSYIRYFAPDGSKAEGLPSVTDESDIDWGLDSSSANLTLSNQHVVGLNDKLQIITVNFLKNEIDASSVNQGHGLIFMEVPRSTGSNNQALVQGSQLDDIYHGTSIVDRFQGHGGNDTFYGGDGDDIAVYSGALSDYIIEQTGDIVTVSDQRPTAPDGLDTLIRIATLQFSDQDLIIQESDLVLNGSNDKDQLKGAGGDDTLIGNAGDDFLDGGDGNDWVQGDLGNDLIISGRGSDTIDGGDGNDVIITGHQYEVEGSTSSIWVTIDDYYSTYGTVSTDRIQLAAGTGNDVVITSQIIDGSNLSGGDGFDILSFNSNTVQPNAEISGFEVWNLAGSYIRYFAPDGSKAEGLPSVTDESDIDWGLDSSSANLTLSNQHVVGLNDKLQIITVNFLKNEIDASSVNQGHGLIFMEVPLSTGSNNQALVQGSQLDDIYHGTSIVDRFQGHGGNDTFYGGDGDDIAVYSGALSDYIIEQTGDIVTVSDQRPTAPDGLDTLIRIATLQFSDQDLIIQESDLVLNGSNDKDQLKGAGGDDTLIGNAGDDFLDGGDGNDWVQGDLGNDLIISGRGSDTIDGGDGNDVIITGHQYEVEASTSSIWVTIDDYYSTYGTVSTDRIQLAAGTGNDVVITSQIIDGSNLSGGDGFDILSFNSNTVQPNAEISGFEVWNLAGSYIRYFAPDGSKAEGLPSVTDESDIDWGLDSSSANLTLSNQHVVGLNDKLQIITVNFLKNEIDASSVNQGHGLIFMKVPLSTGSNNQALVQGSQLDDIYHGTSIVDRFQGHGGNDTFYGGDGDDIAVYSGSSTDYLIEEKSFGEYIVEDKRVGSPDGKDYLNDVNRLLFIDGEVPLIIKGLTIEGTDENETLAGGDDADDIDGGGGDDLLTGGQGQDYLHGGSGDDRLSGGDGADRMEGGDGNDEFLGGPGNDMIIGAAGRNRYRARITGVLMTNETSPNTTVDLSVGLATGSDIGSDNLENIQEVFTDSGNDLLIGNDAHNYLFSGEGNDTLRGASGNDTLMGAQGNDHLDGGPGDDEAIYSGKRSDYGITIDDSIIKIEDRRDSHDGLDTVTGVEFLKFTDSTIGLSNLVPDDKVSSSQSMDLNGDGVTDRFDSILLMRHLLGTFPGESIKQDIPGNVAISDLQSRLQRLLPEATDAASSAKLDIDSDNRITAFSDGLTIAHYIYNQVHNPLAPWEPPPGFMSSSQTPDELQNKLKALIGS